MTLEFSNYCLFFYCVCLSLVLSILRNTYLAGLTINHGTGSDFQWDECQLTAGTAITPNISAVLKDWSYVD